MKNLVICGDSFNIGIGCKDLINEPYGSLLAKELNLNLVNLAKGSSTNFSTYLQVEYALRKIKDIELVIISSTCFHRTEFFNKEAQYGKQQPIVRNESVNYHEYPPYGEGTYITGQILEHPLSSDQEYQPSMYTENYHGILDYVDLLNNSKLNKGGYYKRYDNEDDTRLKLVHDHYFDIWHTGIQRLYDIGMINLSHTLLKNADIPHLVLIEDQELTKIIDEKNQCWVSWGELSQQYPDDLGTLHTSEKGHLEAFDKIYNTLKRNSVI